MLSRLTSKYANALTGIVVDQSGTAMVRVRKGNNANPTLQACHFEAAAENGDSALLKARDLGKQACSTLLNIGEYQLLVVDAPEVPPQELRAAVRWKIQDLIEFSVDEAVLDVFDAPPGGPAGTRKQMYVVVARSQTVRSHIESLEKNGINLKVIDIPELAMCNLAARLPEDEFGLVTLHFNQERCLIILTQNATLYLTRTIEFRYSDLERGTVDPSDVINRLALEIQRSLDYYEQHFHKASIQTIALLPLPFKLEGLATALQDALGLATRSVSLGDFVETDQVLESDSAATCILALGCALRTETRSL